MQDPGLKPVMIVVLDGFADWETPLIAAVGGDFYGLSCRHVTPGGGDVRSMGGLAVTGLADAVPRADEIVVLCGSEAWTRPDAPDMSTMLRSTHARGNAVAAICAGTLALARADACVKHDISLPASRIPAFVQSTDRALAQAFPGVAMRVFGHLGDGNLHYNLLPPAGARHADIQALVHDRVHAAGGSISAEQGIGQLRVHDLQRYKSEVELALMRRIKSALDPQGLMNPGKILAARP